MLGPSHAMSGLAVGALTIPVAPVAGGVEQVAWVAAWAGFAMLPDLDQRGATLGRLWGPVTAILATGIGTIARGHRNGTHDAILAPLLFGGAAVLATLHPWASLALLAFSIGIALKACHNVVPGRLEDSWPTNLAVSWVAAWWLTQHGHAAYEWLPLAVAGGVLVHIAGDALTVGGCPVPFTWIDGKASRYTLGLFKTGAPIEPVLAAGFTAVAAWAFYTNTALPDAWHAIRSTVEALA